MSNIKSSNKSNTMPAAKKTTTKSAAKADVTVPVAAPAATPAPAPVAAPAPAPVAATTPLPAEARSAEAILTSVQDALRSLNIEVTGRIRALVAEATEAAKAVKRSVRESKRRVRKDPATMTPEEKTAWEARRANNAFLKPRLLSDEMATFMGLPAKSQRSQTDVTKFVSQYVKANGCFDPAHKRRIVPDAKLAKLLRVSDDQEVTYLNLQKFLKAHFVKTA